MVMTSTTQIEKSLGHKAFCGDFEYFADASGDLFRARISEAVMPDGRRTGRWEAPAWMADRRLAMLCAPRWSTTTLDPTDEPVKSRRNGE